MLKSIPIIEDILLQFDGLRVSATLTNEFICQTVDVLHSGAVQLYTLRTPTMKIIPIITNLTNLFRLLPSRWCRRFSP